MFRLSVIRISEEYVIIQEPYGVLGGTASAIIFLAFYKYWVLMIASALIDGLIFKAV